MNERLVKIHEARLEEDAVDKMVAEVIPPVSLGAIECSHQQIIPRASRIASQLRDVIESQKLYHLLRGKQYITVEGWTTLLAILGCGVREVNCECIDESEWVATVELFKLSDGAHIGGASAMVGRDENKWKERHARRSMAITRATSKACRLSFSWIMSLAGYTATTAEEMTESVRAVNTDVLPFDPLVAEGLMRSAKDICNRQGSLDALEGWFKNLSRFAKQCIKREPYATQLDELKQSVLPEEKADE